MYGSRNAFVYLWFVHCLRHTTNYLSIIYHNVIVWLVVDGGIVELFIWMKWKLVLVWPRFRFHFHMQLLCAVVSIGCWLAGCTSRSIGRWLCLKWPIRFVRHTDTKPNSSSINKDIGTISSTVHLVNSVVRLESSRWWCFEVFEHCLRLNCVLDSHLWQMFSHSQTLNVHLVFNCKPSTSLSTPLGMIPQRVGLR